MENVPLAKLLLYVRLLKVESQLLGFSIGAPKRLQVLNVSLF